MRKQRLNWIGAVRALLAIALLTWPMAACGRETSGGATSAVTKGATAPVVTTIAPTAAAMGTATADNPDQVATATSAPAIQDDAGSGGDAADGSGDALPVALNEDYSGLLEDTDSEDWYVLTAPGGAVLTVAFEAGTDSEALSVALLSADRDRLTHSADLTAGRSEELRYVLSASFGGDMLLQVTGIGAYAFEISAPLQDDASSAEDAGDTYSAAIQLGAQESFEGLLGDDDVSDWYRVDLAGGSVLALRVAPAAEAEDLSVTLFDSHRQDVWHEWSLPGGVVREIRYLLDAAVSGAYYVAIEGGPGAYAIDLTVALQDDAGSGMDAPANLNDALPVDLNQELLGEIGDEDESDSYRFPASEVLVVSVTPARGAEGIMVVIYDGEGSELWYDYVDEEDTLAYTLEGVLDGDYVLQIAEGFGSYVVAIAE
jgi:hypothetical protein